MITRFAPSPTGYLHLGHAYAALFAAGYARRVGGRFYLRLEDIDHTRCSETFAEAIFEDLAWLGVHWRAPVLRQSQRLEVYAQALRSLRDRRLVYPCFCTRKDIAHEVAAAGGAPHLSENSASRGPLYPGTCRGLSVEVRAARIAEGVPHAWRLDMAAALAQTGAETTPLFWRDARRGEVRAAPEMFGDVVLARKDIPTSYHLSATLDDAAQEVTLVTRGEDLFHATHIHRLLQALLGLETPLYHHHVLLCDSQGRRLAKRDSGVTLRALRRRGLSSGDVRTMVEEKIDENT
ncbi:glutamyl-Q tRNA(Asp) synthetase [Varunaivibrio sulfuroxidans]|uniref:Glutamyl-Q tRNA(Asp) synthetase n=2 Tax=Varunaivibrio sulfuroxidans TaxID=1773489 RepID=A0A4V2UND5_9PROT|nr:glutamyl-Q tRNA(Asp) synthetase [Varunaivibrio sulfuroxidans]